ncbi:response regulator transcription factor [Chryseolinea lacunae]|uniref:Helix-turn-helix domain-containing protein n=1 Tax=Chryseolinea lacunae TaxID=2801331 RepID=A0ABS1KTT4_9BACT|nr:helix-turn-helix domain-containing protein [Chryseolinea lacunae]MBL0742117.1 helix-turn-helix domain-containing protein [Chryseolinea lacunae]
MTPLTASTFQIPEIHFGLNVNHHDQPRFALLIVEQDQAQCAALAAMFCNNYVVHVATTGEQGLALAQQRVPDLILTDLMTLTDDGLPLCAQLKQSESTNHIPVILLSEQTDIYSKMKGLYQGADDFVTRPFHFLELQMRIQNLIQLRCNLQRKYSQPVVPDPADQWQSEDDRFMQHVMTVAEKHLENGGFTIAAFAREVGLSRAQLYRRLMAVTGYSANDFMRRLRLQRAAELLKKRVGNVSEVAYRVGFTSLSYFARCFKEQHHHSPSDYVRKKATPRGTKDITVSWQRRMAEA